MRHIKLFEQISSVLPKVFTTQEIKNMTEDEFFRVMEMYYNEPNPDQAYTLFQVWISAHPEAENNNDWYNKISKYFNFLDNRRNGREGILKDMRDLERDLSLERSEKYIKDLSMEIQRDEEALMRKKKELEELKKVRDMKNS